MTRLRLDQLPANVRRQVEARLEVGGQGKPKRRAKKGAGTTGMAGWCHTCEIPVSSWASWIRHTDETGHRRLELHQAPPYGGVPATPPP